MKSEATRGRLRVNMYLKPKISLLNTQTEKPSNLISCLLFLGIAKELSFELKYHNIQRSFQTSFSRMADFNYNVVTSRGNLPKGGCQTGNGENLEKGSG